MITRQEITVWLGKKGDKEFVERVNEEITDKMLYFHLYDKISAICKKHDN